MTTFFLVKRVLYLLKNQNLNNNFITSPTNTNSNISALPETLFNTNSQFNNNTNPQDLTGLAELPKTYSYLRRVSEPLSKFIKESIKYGYL